MSTRRHELVMPDLGLEDVAATVSLWLVPAGREVIEGDRLLEILAGDVTIDLAAPASGVLREKCVCENEQVRTAQVLGVIVSQNS